MADAFETIIQHLRKDLAVLQVGRASPALLDDINVEAYGTITPLVQLATITSQGAQLLIIQPWDRAILKEVERALRTCGRDYNPVVDGSAIRLPFPPLTEDKRKDLVKIVAEKSEAAKVQIRRVREDLMQDLKTKKTNKELSEDAFFAQQKSIQKKVDDYNHTIEQIHEAKAADVMKL